MFPAFLYLAAVAALPSAFAKTPCEAKVEECEARMLRRPVCGSDDVTYPTRCHLLRARCEANPNLSVVWRGRCSERPACREMARRAGDDGFAPRCQQDGSYSSVQCHEETGYCWCVSPDGQPLPNTSIRHGIPSCPQEGSKVHVKVFRGNRRRKGKVCRKIEKMRFINNLVRKIIKDLCRSEGIEKPQCKKYEEADGYKKAVELKFNTFDKNSDKNLTSDEYGEFQRLVRKAVSPQKCSRSFISICDENKDDTITFEEWTGCLVKRPVGKKNKPKKNGQNGSPHPSFGGGPFGVPSGRGRGMGEILNGHITPGDETESQSGRKEEPEGSDCLTDRKSVIGEQVDVSFELFLPECTSDGRYQKVQCYKSTGYCWCVNEDTGKPIPGTSRKDLNPNCDALQIPLRPMKGCPEHKKKLFLKELKSFKVHLFPAKTNASEIIKSDESDEEFAFKMFQLVDKNKNKFIEKEESWELRKAMTSIAQPLKRCGKKFLKYCDVNHDRKISLTEWVNCLDSERSGVGMTVSPSPQRKGPNPLETILKPDE